ncbi:Thymidylate kinase [uncultured Gammaproteobacteria bacterium]
MARGKLITFEGGEGSGKSTQVRLLVEALSRRGLNVEASREPGGTPGAEAIRALLVAGETGRWTPLTEALLHCAARRDHVERRLWPALAAGTWVVCDRFADSTMAYQGYGHQLGRETIERLTAATLNGFGPDLTFILDIDPAVGLERAGRRSCGTSGTDHSEDRYERMILAFHHRLREGYLDIAHREPARCAVIDATLSPERINALILTKVAEIGPLIHLENC